MWIFCSSTHGFTILLPMICSSSHMDFYNWRASFEGVDIAFTTLTYLIPFTQSCPFPLRRKSYGTGSFYREIVLKPAFFQNVPRRFYRHGMPFTLFLKELAFIRFKAVMLTCSMTYWYSGLFALIDFFARHYSHIPLYVGGIYAMLCEEHLLILFKPIFHG